MYFFVATEYLDEEDTQSETDEDVSSDDGDAEDSGSDDSLFEASSGKNYWRIRHL